ncbi:hypothetical protein DFH06DRAFT_1481403 [Mycena polygramma]|nr:hypothetical protein DFH06DRAFT_1481403 [Mycena polygramma]
MSSRPWLSRPSLQVDAAAGSSVWKKLPIKIVAPTLTSLPRRNPFSSRTSDIPSSTSSQSDPLLLQRIDRLEAELSALKDVVYGGPKTDVDVEMATFEASVDSELVSARRLPPGALPVRAWFRSAVPVNARCHMLWDDNSSKLTVTFSDATPGAAHALELDLREVVSVNYTDPDDTRNHPVVALRTKQMQITLSLEACDAEWSGTRYRELVAWLQAQLGENDGVDVFCCRYSVTQTIWETMAGAANEEERRAPAAPKQSMVNSAALSAQNLFRATFGPKHHLQLEPGTKYLPVKAWYLRRRLSQAEDAYVVWPVSGQVCIVSGAGDDVAGNVEELDIGTAKCAWFVDPKENYTNKVLVLQTAELEPSGASSSGGESQILIKFDGASAKWAESAYEAFVSWIKGKVDQYAVIRGKIGDAKWEAATKTFALMGTDTRASVGGEARAELEGGQTRALNNERPEPRRGLPIAGGGEARAELEGEQTRALDNEPCARINFDSPFVPGNRKSMKPKNPIAAPLENDRPKAIPANKPANKNPFLPIKAWYLGRKLFEEPYHLTWTAAGKLTIRSDHPNVEGNHSEEIDLAWFAKCVWFVEPNEPYPDKVFVLETYETFNNKNAGTQKPFGAQFSEFFKPGSKHAEGHVIIKFDSTSPAWADPVYAQFVDWLRAKVDVRERLRGKTGDAKWDAMNRVNPAAKAAEARIRRENGGSTASTSRNPARAKSPETPPTDDWSSPPASARLKRKRSSDASTEDDSLSYPRPRLLNNPADSETAGDGPRRSARQSVSPQGPYVDPDEVILVYPPGQTRAVNITNGDVTRLAPGEFLNDTLIEFGLKLWLQDLEQKDPELVKQIHVFNSFFYKKLNKKNPMEGYESVRKWTSKIDIFDKKYIIVPINENLHWYLAIIYQPEHTLRPPPSTKAPATRQKTRKGVELDPLFGGPMEVDAAEEQPPAATMVDPANNGNSHTASEGPAEPGIMDADAHDDSYQSDPLDLFADELSPRTVSEPMANSYSSPDKSRGKRKATSPSLATSPPPETLPSEVYEEHDDGQPSTYIFTLDSLGCRHPRVVNVLGQYLKHEAQERKEIPLEMSRKAIGKAALVPHQPNLYDSGIYLLHLAETFISDPSRYYNIVVTQKNITNSLQRQIDWRDDKTKALRQSLADRIGELSVEWKKNRAAQVKKTQEDSDVDTVPVDPGKALRMRG